MAEEIKKEQEESGGFAGAMYDWLQALVFALVCIILLFVFVGRFIYVDGPSMVPTLHDKDMMVVREIGYTPRQGDVVVLTQAFRNVTGPIVKRVIATGGQTVDINYEAGTVTVDGVVLDETYINYEPMQTPWYEHQTQLTVPEGHIFVMGDNRNHSNDSRDVELGVIDSRRVIGQVLLVMFPFQNFGTVG